MNIKHVYWFACYDLRGPSVRYRGKYLLEKLKSKGLTYSFVYPNYKVKGIIKFLKIYSEILLFRKKNSIIVFQKLYTKGIYNLLLKILVKIRKKRSFYDIDDAYYIQYGDKTINYFIENCNHCISGSKALFKYCKKLNKNTSILSSPILLFDNLKPHKKEKFTIGWIGFYNYHRISLFKILFPALMKLTFDFRLVLLGVEKDEHFNEVNNYFKNLSNIEIKMPKIKDWQDEEKIYGIINQFSIGVSPLVENEINKAKSAFKLKQYLSCGVPVVGSATGENSTIIKNGFNGYIANTHLEFVEKIDVFHNMGKQDYLNLKKNALDSVRKYDINNYALNFLEIVSSM